MTNTKFVKYTFDYFNRGFIQVQVVVLYFLFQLLEALLTTLFIVVLEYMFLYLPYVINKRETDFVPCFRTFIGINRTWNTNEIKVDNRVKGRELLVIRQLEEPYLRVESIGRDDVLVEMWESLDVIGLSPPEATRVHGIFAWRPSITAVSVISSC